MSREWIRIGRERRAKEKTRRIGRADYAIEVLEGRVLLSDGQIYVAHLGTISEYSTTGATINASLISYSGFAKGLAVGGQNLFLVDQTNGRISEYTTAGAMVNLSLITGLNNPEGIAISGTDLYVASFNAGMGVIGKYTTSGGTVNANLVTGLSFQFGPVGLVVSGSNLFVTTGTDAGKIAEFTTSGATVNASLVTELAFPAGLAILGQNLFVTEGFNNAGFVGEFTTSGATVNHTLLSGLNNPEGIVVSGTDVFIDSYQPAGVGQYTTTGTVNSTLVSLGDSDEVDGFFVVPGQSTAVASTLTAGTASGTYGGSATLSATLTAGGMPVVGKTLLFSVAGSTVGMGVTDQMGIASYEYSLGTTPVEMEGVHVDFLGDSSDLAVGQDFKLLIGKATLSVNLSGLTKTYGQAGMEGGTVVGIKNGENISVGLTSKGDGPTADVGSYPIDAALSDHGTGGALGNYTVSATNGNLVVGKATLMVTASNNSKLFGDVAVDSGMVLGIQNGDDISATFSSMGDPAGAAAGMYPISAQLSGAKISDYSFGDLSNLAMLTVTNPNAAVTGIVGTNTEATYGSAAGVTATLALKAGGIPVSGVVLSFNLGNGGALVTAMTNQMGMATVDFPVTTPPGIYRVTISFAADATHAASTGGGSVTITPAPLVVTANNNTKTQGQAGTESGTISGIKNGDDIAASFSSIGDPAAAGAGIYPISAIVSGMKLSNYTHGDLSNVGTLTVTVANADKPVALLEPLTAPVAGATSVDISVAYSGTNKIDAATVMQGNVIVDTPAGASLLPKLVSSQALGNLVVATYRLFADAGGFAGNTAPYVIRLAALSVRDTAGTPADAGTLGTFSVAPVVQVTQKIGGVDSSVGNGTGSVNSFLPVGKVQLLDTLTLSGGSSLAAGLDAAARLVLVKFTSSGTIDTTFGDDGFQVSNDLPTSFIILNLEFNHANGTILLVGSSGTNGTPAVLRVTQDGEADGSFNGGNPVALAGLAPNVDQVAAATQMPNGQIIAVGTRVTGGRKLFAARFTTSGQVVTTFGNAHGFYYYPRQAGATDQLTSVSVMGNNNNGNIVAGGTYHGMALVVTLTAGGLTANASANAVFHVAGAGFATANQVLPQTDGSVILVAGIANSENDAVDGDSKVAVTHLMASGKIDSGFGNKGAFVVDPDSAAAPAAPPSINAKATPTINPAEATQSDLQALINTANAVLSQFGGGGILFLAKEQSNGTTEVTAIGLRLAGADLKALLAIGGKSFKAGGPVVAALSVSNAGNMIVSGAFTATLYFSTDTLPSTDDLKKIFSLNVKNLDPAAKKPAAFPLKWVAPKLAGKYHLLVVLAASKTIGDFNAMDDVGAIPGVITVAKK